MRRLAMTLVLAACGSQSSPNPPPVAETPKSPTTAPMPDAGGCMTVIQPAAPGHTSVEPDDMVCTHGDNALECPASFDGVGQHCQHALPGKVAAARGDLKLAIAEHRLWCCPWSF